MDVWDSGRQVVPGLPDLRAVSGASGRGYDHLFGSPSRLSGALRALEKFHHAILGAGAWDTSTRVAVFSAMDMSREFIERLGSIPPPWAARLRRCRGPRCAAPYFWNAHDNAASRTYCRDTCRKAASRAVRAGRA
jgi:hypothetical protein